MNVEEIKIELTNYCKRGCIHCSSNACIDNVIEIDIKKIYDIVDQAKQMDIKSIVLTGGEATEYKDIEKVVQYIKQAGIPEIKLYTMCEPTEEKFNLVKKLHELGLTEVIYSLTIDLTTDGALTFSNIIPFLKEICNLMPLSFHYCMTKRTVASFSKVASIIETLNKDNFKSLSLLRYVEHGRGTSLLTLTSDDLKTLKPAIIELCKKYPNKIHLGSPFNILNISYTPCTAGEKTMIVGYDGSVYPCDAMKYFNYLGSGGNIYRDTLKEIYNSSYFVNIREKKDLINQECENCDNEYCKGGCLGQKILNTLNRRDALTTTWYQENALRTINNFSSKELLKLNAYTGIIGEYGEFFDYIKKLYTHNLSEEKKQEIFKLAPNELGDLVWYLTTSLALTYGYTFDEIYSYIIKENNQAKEITPDLIEASASAKDPLCAYYENPGYDLDSINNFLIDYTSQDILSILMDFKKYLNRLDDITDKNDAIKKVSAVILRIASIAKYLFNKSLSAILLDNIEKLRKRYPEGFSTSVANKRIDANKRYKEEEETKVRNLIPNS